MNTLINRGLITRRSHPHDARRVLLSLSAKGQELMVALLPRFNAEEAWVTGSLAEEDALRLTRSLRAVVEQVESS